MHSKISLDSTHALKVIKTTKCGHIEILIKTIKSFLNI